MRGTFDVWVRQPYARTRKLGPGFARVEQVVATCRDFAHYRNLNGVGLESESELDSGFIS